MTSYRDVLARRSIKPLSIEREPITTGMVILGNCARPAKVVGYDGIPREREARSVRRG